MTKNERIEKRAVKLYAVFSGYPNNHELFQKLHQKHILFFRNLARKLIRLEDKVKELQLVNKRVWKHFKNA